MNLLVINPGSTSTKIAVYENDVPRLVRNIRHTVDELSSFSHIIDQFEFRKNLVLKELEANNIPSGARRTAETHTGRRIRSE